MLSVYHFSISGRNLVAEGASYITARSFLLMGVEAHNSTIASTFN